jgi:hypothetical protein
MTERFWLNSENTLFVTMVDQPRFLPYVAISKVEWLIGDPREGARATMVIQGQLPQANYLFGFENGIGLEVLHHKYGQRDLYVPEKVIARFSNCEILNKWIDNLVMPYMDLTEGIALSVHMQADFKVMVR